MIWRFLVLVAPVLFTGCAGFEPKMGLTYDLFSNQAKFEFSLSPGKQNKSVVPLEK